MARQDDSASESPTGGGVETWRRPDPLTDPLPADAAPSTAEIPAAGASPDRDDLEDLAVFSDYRPARTEPRPAPTDPTVLALTAATPSRRHPNGLAIWCRCPGPGRSPCRARRQGAYPGPML